MKRRPPKNDTKLTTRAYIAVGIALVLTVPSIGALIMGSRYIGRIVHSSEFLILFTGISLALGLVMVYVTKRIAPRLLSNDQPNREFRELKQAVIFLMLLGATSVMICFFGVINAKLGGSERVVEVSTVVKKDNRRLYKRRAHYVTVEVYSTQQEIMVTEQQWRELAVGDPIQIVIRKGFLGYEYIED
jgi:hypothetical protein